MSLNEFCLVDIYMTEKYKWNLKYLDETHRMVFRPEKSCKIFSLGSKFQQTLTLTGRPSWFLL